MKTKCPAPGPDFKAYLQAELLKRCDANPRYSLRAFAKSLGIEPSALSKIMKGKRRMSLSTFERLAKRLGLTPQARDRYAPPIKLSRKGNPAPTPAYSELDLERFEKISDWYHFAILELTNLASFQCDARWVAKELSISVAQAGIALDRLIESGMLAKDSSGRWSDESGNLTVYQAGRSSATLRKLQRQVLGKSLEALDEVPIEIRDHSSVTVAIDVSKLHLARAKIQEFRRELCATLKSEDTPPSAVYQLSVSLFPLSQIQLKS